MLRIICTPYYDEEYIQIYASKTAYDVVNYDLLLQGSELSVDVELDLIFYNKPEMKKHIPLHNLEIVVTDEKTKAWINAIKEYLEDEEEEEFSSSSSDDVNNKESSSSSNNDRESSS